LLLVVEAVLSAEAVFLGNAGEAERLAGKPAAKDVVSRDVSHGYRMNVAARFFTEIGLVGDLGEFVPVGGEHALPSGFFKGDSESSNPAEEVDEAKRTWQVSVEHVAVGRLLFFYVVGLFSAMHGHRSMPSQSNAAVVLSAAASLVTLRIVRLRSPRSIPLM
jgi:hypothetical protein